MSRQRPSEPDSRLLRCFRILHPPGKRYLSFPLENQGPTGKKHAQTSNRAELRAVVAALRFQWWHAEGSDMLIATDSRYVVDGIAMCLQKWIQNGWKTHMGAPVENQDLWRCLLGEIERADDSAIRVQFWHIPKEWNLVAHRHAKAAAGDDGCDGFSDTIDILG